MGVMVGSARIDENGHAYNGKAGDQTGKEVSTQAYYVHSKGWRVFRANDPSKRKMIADCMKWACDNNCIGYDQYERNSLYKVAEPYGFDVRKVRTNTETDCSALVRVCCAYAGIKGIPSSFRTVNEPSELLKTGAFTELTGSKYQSQSEYLAAGDILCTKSSGHTVVVLNDGAKVESNVTNPTKAYAFGERELSHGCVGADVKTLQEYLIKLGFSCGSFGADSDFGDCTEIAVRDFQREYDLDVDGVVGKNTFAALTTALYETEKTSSTVIIQNGNCWMRKGAGTDFEKVKVAYKGQTFRVIAESEGWVNVDDNGVSLWVSSKYAKAV